MKKALRNLAKDYVKVIKQIENTTDLKKLRDLEEKRIEFHWQLIDLLKRQGIKLIDREHATRIALRIAKDEI